MALTFDDGPDPRFTPRLLATLDARRVHVTFFLLGPMVQAAPGLAAHRLGLRPILWSSWGREWVRGATPGSVQATLASTLDGGATVLLHDSEAAAPAGTAAAALGALPWLLDECARRGLRAGPLAGHLADGPRPG